jgi:hypothetical protein
MKLIDLDDWVEECVADDIDEDRAWELVIMYALHKHKTAAERVNS